MALNFGKRLGKNKRTMVSSSTDNANLNTVSGVPTGKSVKDVKTLSGVEVVDGPLPVDHKDMLGDFEVDRAPLFTSSL